MCFEVYLQWFRDEDPDSIPLSTVSDALDHLLVSRDGLCWQLTEGEASLGSAPQRGPTEISSLTIHRPSTSPDLWGALYALLEVGNGVFYFPGGGPLIAHAEAKSHLPTDMVNTLGEPIVARSGEDLVAAVKAAP